MEDPIDTILVVGGGEDLRDDEFAAASNVYRVVAEIGMFEEDSRVFFVDADGVFNSDGGAGFVREDGVEVVDYAFAVAAETGEC